MTDTEFAVVGAGALGLATASVLARRGREVVVFEARTVGNELAGSKGSVRQFRCGGPVPPYIELGMAALDHWRALEHASGLSLLQPTGQLTFGPGVDWFASALVAMGPDYPVERLSADEAGARFPGMRVDGPAILEPLSGVLLADRCLEAFRATEGVHLEESSPVRELRDDGTGVQLDVGERTVTASIAIVCAGHHSPALLRQRDRVVTRPTLEQAAYLRPRSGDTWSVPSFTVLDEPPRLYGLPAPDGLVKVAIGGVGPTVAPETTDLRPDAGLLDDLRAAVVSWLPGFDPEPVHVERCFYDNTADGHFVLDRVDRIVVGYGTSGGGFKYASVLGAIIADLATGTEPAFDLTMFRNRTR